MDTQERGLHPIEFAHHLEDMLRTLEQYTRLMPRARGYVSINQTFVGNTPTALVSAQLNRKNLLIQNYGTDTIYLGTNNQVSVDRGFPLKSGASFNDDASDSEYWAISDTDGVDIRILVVV